MSSMGPTGPTNSTTLETLEAKELKRMASLPSLPWTEQQETLRSMKALLERWLKTSAEKTDADALTRQLYRLSLEQTLQNVAATVSSSVSRITTASLELLQLLLLRQILPE